MEWTKEQRKVIELRDRDILVSAAAGSGKTAVLVERIISRITEGEHPLDIDQLLVVTFTRAAAAEMRERIGAAVGRLCELHPDNSHLRRQSALVHNAMITTIDSFCLFVVRNHFEEIGLDLESKNIGLAYFNYTDGSTQIIADPEQLRRVIHNIIGNSIKYLDKQRGLINIRIKDVGDFIQVEIEDNGRGIAAADLPYIFDRFYRTDASRNSATGGSGIGLSIVKKIIEDHGGKIWATSKESIGTVMYFVIRKYQEVPNEQSINS